MIENRVLSLDSEEFEVLLSIFEREHKRFKRSNDMQLILDYGFIFESLEAKFKELKGKKKRWIK